MKLDKLVYDVRESVSQYQDDSLITDDYIIYLLGTFRSKILKNQLNNFQVIINQLTQQTLCLELEEVPVFECGIEFGCDTIIRTVRPIPLPLKSHLGLAITSVRTVDRLSVPMKAIQPEAASYHLSGRYNNSIYYFIGTDMRIYFISKNKMLNLLDCISITGIFADPLELEDYSNCCGCDDSEETQCYNIYESDYPVDPDLADDITRYVIEKLVNKLQNPTDSVNDATSK